MGRTRPWLISAAIHGALLLAAALLALDHFVSWDACGSGAGFECSVQSPTVVFDRIERPLDSFQRKGTLPDPQPSFEEEAGRFGIDVRIGCGPEEPTICPCCVGCTFCDCGYGCACTWALRMARKGEEFLTRTQSMMNNRIGTVRLRTAPRN